MTFGRDQRELIARDAEAGNRADGDVSEIRALPEVLPRSDVRQVNLDEGDPDRQQGVAQRDTRVREGRWIEQNEVDALLPRGMNAPDELVLGIALVANERVAVGLGELAEARLDLFERRAAIDRRLALTEQAEIRAIEQLHIFAADRGSIFRERAPGLIWPD